MKGNLECVDEAGQGSSTDAIRRDCPFRSEVRSQMRTHWPSMFGGRRWSRCCGERWTLAIEVFGSGLAGAPTEQWPW